MGTELEVYKKGNALAGNISELMSDALKSHTGHDLRELIESGRLLDEQGRSFVTTEQPLDNGRSNFVSDAESAAVSAISNGKAILLEENGQELQPCQLSYHVEKEIDPKTRQPSGTKRTSLKIGNPMNENDYQDITRRGRNEYLKTVQEMHPSFYKEGGIKKPGWINQQVDKLLRWLTGTGTDAMETYRTLSAGLTEISAPKDIRNRVEQQKATASKALEEKWQTEKVKMHEANRGTEMKLAELWLSDDALLNYGEQRGKPISEKDKKLAKEFRTTLLGKAEKDWRVRALIVDMSKTFEQKTRSYAFAQLLQDDEVTPMRKMFQSFRENGTSDLEKYKKELGEQIEAAANKIGKPVISTNQPAPTGKITNLQQDLEKSALDV